MVISQDPFSPWNRRNKENGAILVIVALMLVALLTLIALVMDIGVAQSTQSKMRSLAGYAALGALETYLSSSATTLTQKVNDAQTRAKNIVGENLNITLAQPFLQNGAAPTPDLDIGGQGPNQTDGQLIPGRWWFAEPPGGCGAFGGGGSCPCQGTAWSGPCFKEENNYAANPINAFQVKLQTRPNSPLRNIFSAIVTNSGIMVRAESTATIKPRHVVMEMDLSSSLTFDTHLPIDPLYGPDDPPSAAFLPGTASPYMPANYAYAASATPPAPVYPPANMTANRPSSPPNDLRFGSQRHYVNDYHSYNVTGQDTYYVDDYTSGWYNGPQPFTSVLDAMHAALDQIEHKSVAGDLVGIVGFDNFLTGGTGAGAIAMRTLPGGTSLAIPRTGNSQFDTMKRITDTQTPGNLLERIQQHFFIPSGGDTNFPAALYNAEYMLAGSATPVFDGSFESIVLMFSDGLTDCQNENTCPEPGCHTGGACSNPISWYYNQSFNRTLDALAEYADGTKNISFNLFLMGRQASPNTLIVKSLRDPNKCMDAAEAAATRQGDPNFVYTNGTCTGYTPDKPCLMGNNFWGSSIGTLGMMVPIRPPLLDSTNNPINFAHDLDTICQNAPQTVPPATPAPIIPSPPPLPNFTQHPGYPGCTTCGDPNLNNQGIVYYDPAGRTEVQQIQEAISNILNQNPYALVE